MYSGGMCFVWCYRNDLLILFVWMSGLVMYIYNSWIIFDDLLALLIPQNELSDISRIGSREKKLQFLCGPNKTHTIFRKENSFRFSLKRSNVIFLGTWSKRTMFFFSVYLNVISLVVAPKKFNFFLLFSNKNKIFSWRFIGEKKVLIWVCVCLCTCCSMW